ncbi:MAG: Cell division protein DamX [Gammaproteobacteria bacterium]|nr:Cell division protein DamX [Gammaproteobacteria bacterium]
MGEASGLGRRHQAAGGLRPFIGARPGWRSLRLLFAAALLGVTPGPLRAGPLEDGKAAYLANDYARAYQILEPLAEQGDPDAQITLGIMYDYGQGVPRDDAIATEWYRKAALHGMPTVQHNLGVKYFEGIGIDRDYAEAARWWRMAAGLGFAESQYSLGEMYAWGLGQAKDEAEASRWYLAAAEQGHVLAQYRLGVMYAAGRGVPLDHGSAFRWLHEAAEQGMPQAQYQVGRFTEDGIGTTADPDLARRWYRLAADQGYEKAARRLATMARREAASPALATPVATADDPVAASPAVAAAGVSSNPRREEWIRRQAPDHYTLQLVTASDEASVASLIDRPDLGPDRAYFSRALADRTGYTAICGVYRSRAEAQQALTSLPADLQKGRPWVRSFAEVQALLR